ncbi:FAD-binding oxidoreductase [Streptomyces sp. HNM0575]|uniref:NAD(P)/FAD-dependent oxidoreductase n=1 Tax=Streptomyces sp. HNM0575 TaxID=2716338 RepID=UPI00145F80C9|nr:FAD-dependent oxidoreductase [Streptomyces sp. HNM0575]NLU73964.1 FAD-binding oxidoreductase [Streptomyces sp. HNM0575]
MPDRKNKTELLIIGGGVIGVSIAYHCAEAGIDVVLLEKDQFGTATTSQTARAFRTYFPKKVHDSELAVRSLPEFRSFAGKTGTDIGLADLGLLTCLTSPEQAAEIEALLPAHRDVGVKLDLLTPAQAHEYNPWLDPATIEGAVWSPECYRVKPEMLVKGYADAARKLGARLLNETTVTGLNARTGEVTTTAGDFTADAIVIAAGPWSGDVAELAGMELPVWGQFAELLHTDPLADHEIDTPFTFHPVSGLKTMGMGKSFLVGLERISKQEGMRDIWFKAAVEELPKWYPNLDDIELHSAWTGTLDVTPTKSALIGRGEGEHERILFAGGFTGHGLAHAPTAGRIVRDLHRGDDPGVDLTPFSLATSSEHTPA